MILVKKPTVNRKSSKVNIHQAINKDAVICSEYRKTESYIRARSQKTL